MLYLCSCSLLTFKKEQTLSGDILLSKLKKICLEGNGKGRIELVGTKHVFEYESLLDRPHRRYELALAFPIVGEQKVSLSLDPVQVSNSIYRSDFLALLKDKIPKRADSEQIVRAVGEFFVFSADFASAVVDGKWPQQYKAQQIDDHFVMVRETPHYKFVIDNSSDNQRFFERNQYKIFLRSLSETEAVMTLFLIPSTCDR